METGYLQHGQAGQPMRTESVCVRHTMPDIYHAHYEGRWRKVHVQINRLSIVYMGKRIPIVIEGV